MKNLKEIKLTIREKNGLLRDTKGKGYKDVKKFLSPIGELICFYKEGEEGWYEQIVHPGHDDYYRRQVGYLSNIEVINDGLCIITDPNAQKSFMQIKFSPSSSGYRKVEFESYEEYSQRLYVITRADGKKSFFQSGLMETFSKFADFKKMSDKVALLTDCEDTSGKCFFNIDSKKTSDTFVIYEIFNKYLYLITGEEGSRLVHRKSLVQSLCFISHKAINDDVVLLSLSDKKVFFRMDNDSIYVPTSIKKFKGLDNIYIAEEEIDQKKIAIFVNVSTMTKSEKVIFKTYRVDQDQIIFDSEYGSQARLSAKHCKLSSWEFPEKEISM